MYISRLSSAYIFSVNSPYIFDLEVRFTGLWKTNFYRQCLSIQKYPLYVRPTCQTVSQSLGETQGYCSKLVWRTRHQSFFWLERSIERWYMFPYTARSYFRKLCNMQKYWVQRLFVHVNVVYMHRQSYSSNFSPK